MTGGKKCHSDLPNYWEFFLCTYENALRELLRHRFLSNITLLFA